VNEFDYAKFLEEKAAWESLNIDHYRFIGESFSTAYPPERRFTITVFPKKKPEVVIKGEVVSYPRPFNFVEGTTITEIYEWHEGFLRDLDLEWFGVRARYNAQYHYPEEITTFGKPPLNSSGSSGAHSFFKIYEFEDLRE